MKIARFWRLALIVLIAVVTIPLGSAEAQQEQATVRLDGRTVFRVSAVGEIEMQQHTLDKLSDAWLGY